MASTLTERIALSILDREGIAAIWNLHVAAAETHRTGHPGSRDPGDRRGCRESMDQRERARNG